MRIAIAAGGTGGHFYPGLAVARLLKADGWEIRFIIKKGDFVGPLLEREKIDFKSIHASGFVRRIRLSNLFAAIKLFFGFIESVLYFLSVRPNVVLVMGGYLSVPPAWAARLLKIPVVLHEQNAVPGLANRLVRRLASKVAVSFEASLRFFKGAVLTGNPVRPEFERLPNQAESRRKWELDPAKRTILVFGGSQGAHAVNRLVIEALSALKNYSDGWQLIHFSGPADAKFVKESYSKLGFRHHTDAYCHEMPAAYAASDLVICRSGASTITELMAVQKPAILIPYPLATEGHQKANAEELSQIGAALVYEEKTLKGGMLTGVLENMMRNPSELDRLRARYADLSVKPFDAAKNVKRLVEEVSAEKKR